MTSDSNPSSNRTTLGLKLPRGWRILIVDDFRDSADALSVLLRFSGNKCETAYSSSECILIARRWHPEIILLDLEMPGIDGFDTCEKLRREPWGTSVKIFALTGLSTPSARQKAREAGFDAHITKPVDPEEIALLLAAHFPDALSI